MAEFWVGTISAALAKIFFVQQPHSRGKNSRPTKVANHMSWVGLINHGQAAYVSM